MLSAKLWVFRGRQHGVYAHNAAMTQSEVDVKQAEKIPLRQEEENVRKGRRNILGVREGHEPRRESKHGIQHCA